MEHTERADLSETTLGLTQMKKSFELIMKLINSSVADEVEVFWEKKKKSSVLRLHKHCEESRSVSVFWGCWFCDTFSKVSSNCFHTESYGINLSAPGNVTW